MTYQPDFVSLIARSLKADTQGSRGVRAAHEEGYSRSLSLLAHALNDEEPAKKKLVAVKNRRLFR